MIPPLRIYFNRCDFHHGLLGIRDLGLGKNPQSAIRNQVLLLLAFPNIILPADVWSVEVTTTARSSPI